MSLAVAAMLLSTAASAHHTIAYVDDVSKTVALTGTVTAIAWKAPHVIFDLSVPREWTTPVVWQIESQAPFILHRDGIERDTIKVGDHVTMDVYVALDGSPHAATESVMLRDGRTVRISMKGNAAPTIVPKATVNRP
jgi:hypothetical protein